MAPITTPSSEALIRRFLPLADSIARRFAARWQRVIELDDAQQIARLTLVTKARDVRNPATAPAFLKAHIHGALQHWLRDHSRLVQIPRRAQEASGYACFDGPFFRKRSCECVFYFSEYRSLIICFKRVHYDVGRQDQYA